MNQVELELETYQHGRVKAAKGISINEEKGRANTNPYAQSVFRRFVQPLAEIIRDDIAKKLTGRRAMHIQLLSPIDPEAVAFIAVRGVLTTLMQDASVNARRITHAIGQSVYHEHCLSIFEHVAPDLFYTLTNDFGRRMSKSERHRMTVFKMQARANGVEFQEWGLGNTDQVGAYLVDTLEFLGMLTTSRNMASKNGKPTTSHEVRLSDEVMAIINRITDRVVETAPYFLPCIEQPKDWVAFDDGGFHTTEMRRMMPFAVACRAAQRDHFRQADLGTTLAGLNALQAVRWRVNKRMLLAVKAIAKHFDMDEVLSQAEHPSPPRPPFLDTVEKDDMTEEQLKEFSRWKREKAEWHTEMKLRGTKWGRFTTCLRVAEQFKDFDAIHFVYFADFRDRKYAQTTGISPQGSDLQKAMLQAADGMPIHGDIDAIRWFLITGANKWGFDKAPLMDRVKWVEDRKDMLLSFAADPISNNEWREADAPLQFLAWCFEYQDFIHNPATFRTRYPIAMDGTCNGLQNFSAMLRDEVGGRATNLLPSAPGEYANDIYAMVALRTAELLQQSEEDERGYRSLWLKHGLNRTLVKRSVMTLPYGSTRYSCADFIVGDYLKQGKAPEFAKDQYGKAANFLSHFVWEAIDHVVVKARHAMDWLQSSARTLVSQGIDAITWVTPSGFPAIQTYWKQNIHRINTKLHGSAKLVVLSDTDIADRNNHKNGIAPNFIHSMDAAHLTLVALRCKEEGIDFLAMIHDDYGVLAPHAHRLFTIIREVFYEIYTNHRPLEEFAERYTGLSQPPSSGNLDLSQVLNSEFFFS